MRRILPAVLVAAAALVLAVGAVAHGKGEKALRSTLAPSVPAPADPAIHGVNPGGVPWILSRGDVELKADGRLRLEVEGLVIPGRGDPGPVSSIAASLYCGADTTAAATTSTVPLSSAGDARIDAQLTLPASCLAPVVLVNPNGNPAAYIAVTGWVS